MFNQKNVKIKDNVLIINWGTETAKLVLAECVSLKRFNFFLVSTDLIPKEIEELFGRDHIIFSNPYDPIKLCEDVSRFSNENKVFFNIVTTFFEMCVYQTAFLADFLKIEKSLPLKSAIKTSVNKYLMRMELEKVGINQPKYFKFDKNSIKEAYDFFKKIKKPAVIKPVHSGHSYGVRYVKLELDFISFKELFDGAKQDYCRHYDEWMEYENIDRVEFLLEEFIEGKIFSFDGVVGINGNADFIGSTEFELSMPPIMQQIGHTMPIYSLSLEEIKAGKNYIKKIVKVLGLKYCGFHGEVKYLNGKPLLIEIAGRLPGGVITKSYQNLSKYNVINKFMSIFEENNKKNRSLNKECYVSETMKIIFSDNDVGVVENSPGEIYVEKKNYVYKIRSRDNGEKICEKNNPFGVWLYEIVLRSKNMSARKLINKRDRLIGNQKIKVVAVNFGIFNNIFVKK